MIEYFQAHHIKASTRLRFTPPKLAPVGRQAEVTGVCGAPRIEYVRTLGADRILDYTKEDFTAGDETYDLVV